ncbi:hypothetical protein AAFF_G00407890 [Aldrovandia affinis]|uniref:Anticodon-binding domain-containing protein n=1 Tax=Aldrovandia affinis TaxID=143900 RepID=A0AAD7SBS4_9TELE|nr:hypothetical protein AAFF_G00407890 [Aldrovandia affinis]
MLTYCYRRQVFICRRPAVLSVLQCRFANPLQPGRNSRSLGSATDDTDHTSTFIQFCSDRHYIIRDHLHGESFLRGISGPYGPLGMELQKNILDKWWTSVVMSRAQVFGISTLHLTRTTPATKESTLKLVDSNALDHILNQKGLNWEQVRDTLKKLLVDSSPLRMNLLQGALEQYLPSLELVHKRLPFGLAETGVCYQPQGQSNVPACPAEVTQASLVWFCSPRTSSQWLDYWARQRLQWWRKFALGPSSFSCSDITDGEEGERASRGVKILYNFPWGAEPLETLSSLGDMELLKAHKGSRAKLQCKDGRKSVVPHVISVCGNIDRGVLAYLHNSLQEIKKTDSKQRLHKRKVLKLHPSLAPVKVSLDTGRGPTVELRQVCDGLLQELLDGGISTWPGYQETMPSSMEQLNTKYDEMGVLFTIAITDITLESGLVQVRNRDTTIKETMHISEVRMFLTKYISASENI